MDNPINKFKQAEAAHTRALAPLFKLPLCKWDRVQFARITETANLAAAAFESLTDADKQTVDPERMGQIQEARKAHALALQALFREARAQEVQRNARKVAVRSVEEIVAGFGSRAEA